MNLKHILCRLLTMRTKWGTWYKIEFEKELIDLYKEEWFRGILVGLIVGYILMKCVP